MTGLYRMAAAPGALPLVGHALAFLRRPQDFVAGLPAYGDVVHIRLGRLRAYVVCHPDLIHRVLTDDRTFDKGGPLLDALRLVAGDGLTTSPAPTHRRQRRLLQPAFHRDRMPGYAALMNQEIIAITASWRHGQAIDVPAQMHRLSAAIAARCLFGSDIEASGLASVDKSISDFASGITTQLVTTSVLSVANKLPTPGNRRFEKARDHLRQLTDRLITSHTPDSTDQPSLMSLLLAARDEDGRGLTDTEIHDQVATFILASIETTASVLAWALHLLGTHPDLQQRLQAEADEVLHGPTPHYTDLPALEMTSLFITETLRLYPPGWLITRTTTTDTELGGHPLPAGTTVFYSPYQLHRRPDLHPDPDRFDPDRWNSDKTPHQAALIPFGGGPRKCMGDVFGITEATLTLAAIAAQWHLHPIPGQHARPARQAALTPHSYSLRLQQRHTTS